MMVAGKTKATPHGKMNWNKLLKALKKDGGIHTTTKVWEDFVSKEVNRYRTKEKLHQFHDQGKVARIYKDGRYYWSANPVIIKRLKELRSQQQAP